MAAGDPCTSVQLWRVDDTCVPRRTAVVDDYQGLELGVVHLFLHVPGRDHVRGGEQ